MGCQARVNDTFRRLPGCAKPGTKSRRMSGCVVMGVVRRVRGKLRIH